MKIVIAPDSFKGSLSAKEVAQAIKEGIHLVNPNIETVVIPLADGGEGTVESLVYATNGQKVETEVKDPLGRPIKASYGILGDGSTCVIETASASGLPLLSNHERNPWITSSYGTGELVKHALDLGYRKFIIGLGGSATNDGGAGILQALGVRFLNVQGEELPFGGGNLNQLADIDLSKFDPRIQQSEFIVACDVNNPLIGPKGASYVFGPQKGATKDMIDKLDQNLTHFANKIEQKLNMSIHHRIGAGAAGGIGGALLGFFHATMESGIQIVMKELEMKKQLQGASMVITGEGQIDHQTAHGKTPAGIARLAKKYGIPTIALAGSVGHGVEQLRDDGIQAVFSVVNGPISLEKAMEQCHPLLVFKTEQIIRLYLLKK